MACPAGGQCCGEGKLHAGRLLSAHGAFRHRPPHERFFASGLTAPLVFCPKQNSICTTKAPKAKRFKITEIGSITYTLCVLCAFVVKIPKHIFICIGQNTSYSASIGGGMSWDFSAAENPRNNTTCHYRKNNND